MGQAQHLGAGDQLDLKATGAAGLGDHQVQKEEPHCRTTPWHEQGELLQQTLGPSGTETPSAVATTRRGPVRVRELEEEEELGETG